MRSILSLNSSVAVLALVLVACGQAESPAESEVAEPVIPPVQEDTAVEAADVAEIPDVAEVSEEAEPDADHAEEAADHDHHDDHDDEAHEDHEEHAHDDDHDHAGGSAHVHGVGQMSIILDGGALTVDLIAPLSNFGLAEDGSTGDVELNAMLDAEGPFVFPSTDARCGDPDREAKVDATDGLVTWTFNCAAPDALADVSTELIDVFPGFESIETVGLKGDDETVAVITSSDQRFFFD